MGHILHMDNTHSFESQVRDNLLETMKAFLNKPSISLVLASCRTRHPFGRIGSHVSQRPNDNANAHQTTRSAVQKNGHKHENTRSKRPATCTISSTITGRMNDTCLVLGMCLRYAYSRDRILDPCVTLWRTWEFTGFISRSLRLGLTTEHVCAYL